MIDIPAEIKNVYRAGDTRKGYIINVLEEDEPERYYEIQKLERNTIYEVIPGKRYMVFRNGIGSFTSISTYMTNDPASAMDIYYPDEKYPDTSWTGQFSESYISVNYPVGSDKASLMEVIPAKQADRIDFENNNLVAESVKIDERLCSGDTLKYGLCEGSSLEFEYFGKDSIKGRRLQVWEEVAYTHTLNMPQQTYILQKNLTKNDSTFLPSESGYYRIEIPANSPPCAIYLSTSQGGRTLNYPPSTSPQIGEFYLEIRMGENLGEIDSLELVTASNLLSVAVSKRDIIYVPTERTDYYPISMGFFTVEKCARQASTGIMKVTAYNALKSDVLDTNANHALVEAFTNVVPSTRAISINTVLNSVFSRYAMDTWSPVDVTYQRSDIELDGYGIPVPSYPAQVYDSDGHSVSGKYIAYMSGSEYYSVDNSYITSTTGIQSSSYAALGSWKIDVDGHKFLRVYRTYLEAQERALLSGDSGLPQDGIYFNVNNVIVPFVDYFMSFSRLVFKYQDGSSIGTTSRPYNAQFNPIYTATLFDFGSEVQKSFFKFTAVGSFKVGDNVQSHYTWDTTEQNAFKAYLANWHFEFYWHLSRDPFDDTDSLGTVKVTKEQVQAWPDVTYRELQSAVYESACQYGQLDRETDLFSGVELGAAVSETFTNSQMATLWAEEENVHKWRNIVITYKGLDEEQNETTYVYQQIVNMDGTDDYIVDNNWLFKNLVWTVTQIAEYAENMADKMRDITWSPFEMWAAGLPYLETGDKVVYSMNGENYTSYILQRQLNGIQNLQDTYINGTLDIY